MARSPKYLLGVRRYATSKPATIRFEDDDALVMFTDGLIEADRDIEASERRLRDVLRIWALGGFVEPAKTLQAYVLGKDSGADDVAILVLHLRAVASAIDPVTTLPIAPALHLAAPR